MRRTARALSAALLAGTALGVLSPAASAEPTAEVGESTVAPGGSVTVEVSCDPVGGTPPDTVEAVSRAFAEGTVRLRRATGGDDAASGPAYRGTAKVAPAGDFEEDPDAAGEDSRWTVDGTCPSPSGKDGEPWSAAFTVAHRNGTGSSGSAQECSDPHATDCGDSGSVPGGDSGSEAGGDSESETGGDSESGADGDFASGGDSGSVPGGDSEPGSGGDSESAPGGDSGSEAGGDSGSEAGGDSGSEAGGDFESVPGGDSGSGSGGDSESGADGDFASGGDSGSVPGGDSELESGGDPGSAQPCPDRHATPCGAATVQRGVRAGAGGSFTDSVPALVAGGLLIAGACGAAVHRLRHRDTGIHG
ncbi:hypothetical protein [Streptomyces sp. NPDC052701]|uniref:hypothetical protein n=1 Tax=Streptomyces sp. NPDC052701 TaxID=3155533 RepID=UPI00343D6679